ncbi:6204_t:CDS:2, partial [Ambispora gerdemannii]
IDDPKRRVIALHERVNLLPDANYSTLNYLMGHLDNVADGSGLNDMGWQCKVVETILENYR